MNIFRILSIFIFVLLCLGTLSGCFHHEAIRHISSDASLIIPNQTTEQEILSYMGTPQIKRSLSEAEEEWFYFQENKSLLRKTPIMGAKMGTAHFDVARIRIKNKIVTSCQYRFFTEEEFKQLDIPHDAAL